MSLAMRDDGLNQLLGELTAEHREVQKVMGVFGFLVKMIEAGKSVSIDQLEVYLTFFEQFVGHHHEKEEQELFSRLDAKGCRGGGPKCGLFMDYWINSNHATPLLKEALAAGMSPKPYMKISEGSLLSIPLEEHQAGALAIEMMKQDLDSFKEHGEWSPRFQKVASHYLSMLHLHIRKEEECLFVLAKSVLSA